MGRRRQAQATRKKIKRFVSEGQVHIFATFNNTIVTMTDKQGNTICWASAGNSGFKGSRKSTPYAARMASQGACRTAQDAGMQEVEIVVKGAGRLRARTGDPGRASRWFAYPLHSGYHTCTP